MLNELFTFPVVMIDGKSEQMKAHNNRILGKGDEDGFDDYDIIYGEVEYPYYDFIGLEDRWLPNRKSLARAMDGKFDACAVRFVNVGEILVPWNKKKFKEKLREFAEKYEAALPPKPSDKREVRILTLSPEQYDDIVKDDAKPDNNE